LYELIFFTTSREEAPALEFLLSLAKKPQSKAQKLMLYLQRQGPDLPRPYADVLRGKIRELRVGYGCLQLRFLYFFDGKSIVLVSGFLKKTSAVPEEEIIRAERRMAEWLNR
jgi:hypothetical protein